MAIYMTVKPKTCGECDVKCRNYIDYNADDVFCGVLKTEVDEDSLLENCPVVELAPPILEWKGTLDGIVSENTPITFVIQDDDPVELSVEHNLFIKESSFGDVGFPGDSVEDVKAYCQRIVNNIFQQITGINGGNNGLC